MTGGERFIVALDTPSAEAAARLAAVLRGRVGGLKIGLELFVSSGPAVVATLREAGGLPVMLDLKLHDIPSTVAGAVAAAARLGAAWVTVHALAGEQALRRAREAALEAASAAGLRPPRLLAVTILTSHAAADLARLGIEGSPAEAVVRLARLAREAGADGAVCSPLEVAAVREAFAGGEIVVPGVRPAGRRPPADDQARTATPAEAVARGADRLVVGRPVTAASDPVAAVEELVRDLEGA